MEILNSCLPPFITPFLLGVFCFECLSPPLFNEAAEKNGITNENTVSRRSSVFVKLLHPPLNFQNRLGQHMTFYALIKIV